MTFPGLCEVCINDLEMVVVARNIIFLLCAYALDTSLAVETVFHLWYSAFVPQGMLDALRENVLPLISDVCKKIEGRSDDARLQAKTWTFGSAKVRVMLSKKDWEALRLYFDLPPGFSGARARVVRRSVVEHPSRKDYVERKLYAQTPTMRIGMSAFRKHGILLPFGASKAAFKVPNPYVSSKEKVISGLTCDQGLSIAAEIAGR